ncbi:MAG: class I SAM-dependent methyltransferase [Acidobacteriota bacterium]
MTNPTARFTNRVSDYVRFRPGYPDALLDTLEAGVPLSPDYVVADIGAGTGISTSLLLRAGWTVMAVEPNDAMRAAAEQQLRGRSHLTFVAGTAEVTTLPDQSVDLVAVGQAFHWFDRDKARSEFLRILKSGGRVALFWNVRRLDSDPFAKAYEQLLLTYGTDYTLVTQRHMDATVLTAFFRGPFETHAFPYVQTFDFDGLRGRLLSSSYAPSPGHPQHEPMISTLRQIFDAHQEQGRVHFVYDTQLYLGALA